MKIAFFSENFYPEISGISDSITTTAKELVKLGHQIRFFVPNYSIKNYLTAGLKAKQEIDLGHNIEITRLFSLPYPAPTKQGRMVIPSFSCLLKIKKFKPDIIHTHLFFGAGIEALIAAKLFGIPLVGTNHTAISEFVRYIPFLKSKWLESASIKYANWYYGKCNFVSAPSKSVFTEMEGFGFKVAHSVISNPVSLEAFKVNPEQKKEDLKKHFGINDKTVLYVGRFAKEKNIDVIIQALAIVKKKIPDVRLALAGHGAEQEAMKSLVKKLDLEENVLFTGTLNKFELADLYRASEIFVITSTSETQSMTLIQAMACGLPAIGVRARALPEYIEGNGILIEPGDFKALAQEIIRLLEDPNLRAELGRRGEIFVQKFSEKNIAREWENVYKKQLDNYQKI